MGRIHQYPYTYTAGPYTIKKLVVLNMKLLKYLLPLLLVISCSGFSINSLDGEAVEQTEAEEKIDELEADMEEEEEMEDEEEEEEEEADELEDEEEEEEEEAEEEDDEEEEEDIETVALEAEEEDDDEYDNEDYDEP